MPSSKSKQGDCERIENLAFYERFGGLYATFYEAKRLALDNRATKNSAHVKGSSPDKTRKKRRP
jgi:hypothetical protein